MSRADRGADKPRAMIHRRILDVAESAPDASLSAVAEEVSGASPALVERVLDEYGDPGNDSEADAQDDQQTNATEPGTFEADPASERDGPTTDEAAATPAAADLSEKQLRTLRALYERPDASQGDLAEQLDVTRATVSRRLNAITGFEWDDRRAFAESVFGPGPETGDDAPVPAGDDRGPAVSEGDDDRGSDRGERGGVDPASLDAVEGALTDLTERVEAVESRLSESHEAEATDETTGTDETERGAGAVASVPPELAHKVVHACMESDRLDEDEELDVLRAFMER